MLKAHKIQSIGRVEFQHFRIHAIHYNITS